MLLNTKLLRYYVVPRAMFHSDGQEIVQEVYGAWYKIWKKVFSADNRDYEPNADDFLRQDAIVAIFYEDTVPQLVGFHLYSFFDLRWNLNTKHSYFNGIDAKSFELLQKKNLNHAMTMEYLTVLPEFRKQVSQIPWGEVIIALGLRFMKSTHGDVAFGTARCDVKVDEMASKLGFENLQPPIRKYDYECAVITCSRQNVRFHPDFQTNVLIQQLWSDRVDFRQKIFKKAEAA